MWLNLIGQIGLLTCMLTFILTSKSRTEAILRTCMGIVAILGGMFDIILVNDYNQRVSALCFIFYVGYLMSAFGIAVFQYYIISEGTTTIKMMRHSFWIYIRTMLLIGFTILSRI